MNTGNLLVHQWLVTKYPDIVDYYEQFDDANHLRPIISAGALENDDTETIEDENITAAVTYKTCYTKVVGAPVKKLIQAYRSRYILHLLNLFNPSIRILLQKNQLLLKNALPLVLLIVYIVMLLTRHNRPSSITVSTATNTPQEIQNFLNKPKIFLINVLPKSWRPKVT